MGIIPCTIAFFHFLNRFKTVLKIIGAPNWVFEKIGTSGLLREKKVKAKFMSIEEVKTEELSIISTVKT